MALVLPDFSVKVVRETLNLSDGTALEVTKPPGTDDLTWKETMQYYEANPEEARRGENAVKDARAIRDTLQMNAILDYYNARAGEVDPAPEILKLEENPDLAHIFEDIGADGSQAAMRYYYNEPLMLKFNRLAGGVPEEVTSILEQIHRSPVTIQEAAKFGDEKAVAGYISAGNDVEAADSKGVTILGYAIGANRTKVVKLLMDAKADPACCDSRGSSGLHYAAAYGRQELLEFLSGRLDPSKKNAEGLTPLAIATRNKQTAAIDFLKKRGATL